MLFLNLKQLKNRTTTRVPGCVVIFVSLPGSMRNSLSILIGGESVSGVTPSQFAVRLLTNISADCHETLCVWVGVEEKIMHAKIQFHSVKKTKRKRNKRKDN